MDKHLTPKFIFLLPSLILIGILSYLPLLYAIFLSFHIGRGKSLVFNYFENYMGLLSDEAFIIAFSNSLIFTLIIVPCIIVLSLVVSLSIHKVKSKQLQNLFTAILFIPCITSPVAYSLFVKQLAYSDGTLSNLLRGLNLVSSSYNILQEVWGARLLIAFVCIWAWSGFYILILSVAMNNINPDIYRAAKLDGATDFIIARKIVFPTIRPILALITILATSNTFQIYIESAIITKGGPGMATLTLVNQLYKKSFTYVAQYGYSSAIAIVIFTVCVLVSGMLFIAWSENEAENR